MNLTTTPAFIGFEAGINEALAELDDLAAYCSNTVAMDPGGALQTVQDLQAKIQDAADLIHAHFTLFKRASGKSGSRVMP